MRRTSFLYSLILAGSIVALGAAGATAAPKKDFKVAWSIYVGWMPWGYAADTGIVKKWADKYGITIEVKQFNDYVESINQYTAGAFDAVTMTNMDALSIPAAGGVDTTAVIVGDFSNGNDARDPQGQVRPRRHQGPEGQSGRILGLALPAGARAGERRSSPRSDIKVVNTSDADIVARLQDAGRHRRRDLEAASSRKFSPRPTRTRCSTRSQIPGEIIDLMVANTDGAEGQSRTSARRWSASGTKPSAHDDATGAEGRRRSTAMAKASGTDLAGFDSQLATTKLFDKPADAVAFTKMPDCRHNHGPGAQVPLRRRTCSARARSRPIAVGIELGDKSVLGDKANVKLRFDATYMDAAAKGKL